MSSGSTTLRLAARRSAVTESEALTPRPPPQGSSSSLPLGANASFLVAAKSFALTTRHFESVIQSSSTRSVLRFDATARLLSTETFGHCHTPNLVVILEFGCGPALEGCSNRCRAGRRTNHQPGLLRWLAQTPPASSRLPGRPRARHPPVQSPRRNRTAEKPSRFGARRRRRKVISSAPGASASEPGLGCCSGHSRAFYAPEDVLPIALPHETVPALCVR